MLLVVCFLCLGVVTAVGPAAAQSAGGEALTGEGDSANHDAEGVGDGNHVENDDVAGDDGSVADSSDNSAEADSDTGDNGGAETDDGTEDGGDTENDGDSGDDDGTETDSDTVQRSGAGDERENEGGKSSQEGSGRGGGDSASTVGDSAAEPDDEDDSDGTEDEVDSDDDGATLDVLTRGGTVVTGPPTVGEAAPTDPDSDRLYEDANGDGNHSYSDVELLFENLDQSSVPDHPNVYDFNDNGQVDYGDVVALYDAN